MSFSKPKWTISQVHWQQVSCYACLPNRNLLLEFTILSVKDAIRSITIKYGLGIAVQNWQQMMGRYFGIIHLLKIRFLKSEGWGGSFLLSNIKIKTFDRCFGLVLMRLAMRDMGKPHTHDFFNIRIQDVRSHSGNDYTTSHRDLSD